MFLLTFIAAIFNTVAATIAFLQCDVINCCDAAGSTALFFCAHLVIKENRFLSSVQSNDVVVYLRIAGLHYLLYQHTGFNIQLINNNLSNNLQLLEGEGKVDVEYVPFLGTGRKTPLSFDYR
jgi:hypothetical protein